MTQPPPAFANPRSRLDPALSPSCRRLSRRPGEQVDWDYVKFFIANIRYRDTRRAQARASSGFIALCEKRGLALASMRPLSLADADGDRARQAVCLCSLTQARAFSG